MTTENTNPTPILPPTDRSLPIALLRARETLMIPVREILRQNRISEQKWRALRVIDESGPVEQVRIAQMACLHQPSLIRIMHALERDGLISRTAGEADKRHSIAVITDAGRQLILDYTLQSQKLFTRLESQFGADKLATLLDLLEELQQIQLDEKQAPPSFESSS